MTEGGREDGREGGKEGRRELGMEKGGKEIGQGPWVNLAPNMQYL